MKRKLIIFGAGEKAANLTRMLEGGVIPGVTGHSVIAFADSYKQIGSYFLKRKIIKPKDIRLFPDADVVISTDSILDEVMKQLLELNIDNDVYYFSQSGYRFKWNVTDFLFIPMDIYKPRLPYLEISIFAKCNLNCRGCTKASNIIDSWYMKRDKLKKDYEALKRLFSGIKYLKLFGGEPLLNPELKELIELSRDFWPDSDIVVHSNGVLVPEMNSEVLEAMENRDVTFEFTLYPETGKRQRLIEEKLGKYGVEYVFRKPVYQFYKTINPRGDYDACEVYKACGKCINLIDGKLSCGMDWFFDVLERKFNYSICDDKYQHTVDIHNTELNGWEINRLLDSPYNLCSYCAFMKYSDLDVSQAFDWEPHVKGTLEDWLIDGKNMS